jgi:rhamnosyltransferase subunit B
MQQELGMDRAGLTAAVLSRTDFMFRRLIIPNVRAAYEDMLPLTSGADMVLTSSLAFGARLAAEKSATPRIGIVLQPFMFLSAFDIPAIPTVPWLSSIIQRLGPLPSRGVVWAIRRAADSLLHPIHALRREIGLPSTRRNPLFDGQFSTAGAIGLYSNLLGSAATELGILMGDTGYQMRSVRLREVLRAEDGAAQAARIVLDRIESAQSKNGDVDDELSP